MPNEKDVIDFWFVESSPKDHFQKSDAFDERIRSRFLETHKRACACELYAWRKSAEGRLAEVIVLDQFSRNLFRESAKAFAADTLALALAQEAIALGLDREIEKSRRRFLYMPFMHSESRAIHEVALGLFKDEKNLDYELRHKAIIDRFGRYPHRNVLLGRASTDEEIAFLKTPGSGF